MKEDRQLRLRPHLSVVVHSPNDVELRRGVWNPVSFNLVDKAQQGNLARLVLRLDGTVSPARLAAEEGVPRQQVEQLIDHLIQLDVLEREPTNVIDGLLADTAPWRVDPTAKPGRRVVIVADEDLRPLLQTMLAQVFRDSNVDELSDGSCWELLADNDISWMIDGLATEKRLQPFEDLQDCTLVVAQRIVNPIRMRVLNRGCLRYRIPWVHAAFDGPFAFVGPTFLPYESACYECLETRVYLNLREGASYQRYKAALAAAQVRFGTPPLAAPLASMLCGHLAVEAANLVLTGYSCTTGRMLSIHLPTMEFSFPDVLRIPGCAGCGSVPERDGLALYYDPGSLSAADEKAL